jgi:hypothetical protein
MVQSMMMSASLKLEQDTSTDKRIHLHNPQVLCHYMHDSLSKVYRIYLGVESILMACGLKLILIREHIDTIDKFLLNGLTPHAMTLSMIKTALPRDFGSTQMPMVTSEQSDFSSYETKNQVSTCVRPHHHVYLSDSSDCPSSLLQRGIQMEKHTYFNHCGKLTI